MSDPDVPERPEKRRRKYAGPREPLQMTRDLARGLRCLLPRPVESLSAQERLIVSFLVDTAPAMAAGLWAGLRSQEEKAAAIEHHPELLEDGDVFLCRVAARARGHWLYDVDGHAICCGASECRTYVCLRCFNERWMLRRPTAALRPDDPHWFCPVHVDVDLGFAAVDPGGIGAGAGADESGESGEDDDETVVDE